MAFSAPGASHGPQRQRRTRARGAVRVPPPRRGSLAATRDRGTVAVVLFRDTPMFEDSIPITVFGVDRRGVGLPYYRLLVCSGEPGPLGTTGGVRLTTLYGLAAADSAGTVIVPAWRSPSERPPEAALTALRRAYREGARVVGLDSGTFALAAAGLLDGRPATTHWMYAAALARHYPRVKVNPRELYIDDGSVLTSGGSAAALDLCLHIVRSDHGVEAATGLARRLVFPPARGGGQTPYFDRELPAEVLDDPLAEVMSWALEHLTDTFDVDKLAARASLSRRSFDRRFRALTGSAPLQWLNTQRVLYAQRILESTDLPVDEVAQRSGFGSTVAMRGHFRRLLGTSPTAYRDSYRSLLGSPGNEPPKPTDAAPANPRHDV